MDARSAFHLDCTPIIPECGFDCPKCVQEIVAALTSMQGVGKSYVEDEGGQAKLIVEHDPTMVTVDQLTNVLKGLPSFYEGRFVPIMITS